MVGRRGKEYVYWLKMHGMEAPKWSYSVVVITRDFESRTLGSSPSKTMLYFEYSNTYQYISREIY